MTEPGPRVPYDHALHLINTIGGDINRMTETPIGSPRDLDGPTAVGALTVRSNLAIAAALLAVADVLSNPPERP